MLRALAFVPEEDMVLAYEELLLHIQIPFWRNFLVQYFEVYYIGEPDHYGGARGDGKFPRAYWNVYARTLNGMFRCVLLCYTHFMFETENSKKLQFFVKNIIFVKIDIFWLN